MVRALSADGATPTVIRRRWLAAVATRAVADRPDLEAPLIEVLGDDPSGANFLRTLSIGEISVCYEALVAQLGRDARKKSGQFFTPDDAARFMAEQSSPFGTGMWLDPCCGVGNLSWHLSTVQDDPASFTRDHLTLMDRDETALKTAIALIAASFLDPGDESGVRKLAHRAVRRDALDRAEWPEHDFAIVNPPYARSEPLSWFETANCRDSFAYFLERVAKSSLGYIAVTPASYLAAPKFQPLRDVLNRTHKGGRVFVFDNVPDTLFRGYKFGSNNTSKTNFVRAAITVCAPGADRWSITPILRWQVESRARMLQRCASLLAERRVGPHGEWAKLGPGLDRIWDQLFRETTTVGDLISDLPTPYSLDVGLTPRYFISAAYRNLDRGSKATLYFRSEADRDHAAIVLNSSIPYLWWRALDGGVTLPRRVLLSTPLPVVSSDSAALVRRLRASEEENVVVKRNAGRRNENVKHPLELVSTLNRAVLPGCYDLSAVYANSMFPEDDERAEG